jgi:hypothetical protein
MLEDAYSSIVNELRVEPDSGQGVDWITDRSEAAHLDVALRNGCGLIIRKLNLVDKQRPVGLRVHDSAKEYSAPVLHQHSCLGRKSRPPHRRYVKVSVFVV